MTAHNYRKTHSYFRLRDVVFAHDSNRLRDNYLATCRLFHREMLHASIEHSQEVRLENLTQFSRENELINQEHGFYDMDDDNITVPNTDTDESLSENEEEAQITEMDLLEYEDDLQLRDYYRINNDYDNPNSSQEEPTQTSQSTTIIRMESQTTNNDDMRAEDSAPLDCTLR